MEMGMEIQRQKISTISSGLTRRHIIHRLDPFWLIDGISGYFLSDWDVNVHLLVNVNVPEKMTSRSLTIA